MIQFGHHPDFLPKIPQDFLRDQVGMGNLQRYVRALNQIGCLEDVGERARREAPFDPVLSESLPCLEHLIRTP